MDEWMKKNFYVFVDFETTGVPAEDHYPIQIGIVYTDNKFQVLETYQSMICWSKLIGEIEAVSDFPKFYAWPDQYANAEQYHKISALDYVKASEFEETIPGEIPGTICNAQHRIREMHSIKDSRFILVSDNIQFEWQLMKKLFKERPNYEWPFHYCGWDTSLFLNTVGTGDPKDPPHDALMDASGLHQAVVRSLEKTGWFERIENESNTRN